MHPSILSPRHLLSLIISWFSTTVLEQRIQLAHSNLCRGRYQHGTRYNSRQTNQHHGEADIGAVIVLHMINVSSKQHLIFYKQTKPSSLLSVSNFQLWDLLFHFPGGILHCVFHVDPLLHPQFIRGHKL